MKRIKLILTSGGLVALIAAAVTMPLSTGCTIFNNPGSVITDTNTINTVSNYLSIAVAQAVSYGVKQDSNTVAYANAASAAIGLVLGGTNYSPGALDTALQNLPAAVLKTPTATIITTTVEALYELYWASDVQGAVNGDYAARVYLTAVKTGISAGLSGNVTPVFLKRPPVRLHKR